MKKIVFSLLFSVCVLFLSAQEYKGSVGKATGYVYKEDWKNAKGEIDKAITIEKNAKKSRTWLTRGEIYEKIALNDDEAIRAIDENAATKCADAYSKVIEMDGESSFNGVKASTQLSNLSQQLISKGYNDHYEKGDLEGALVYFQNALAVQPEDSMSLYLVAATSQELEDIDLSVKTYRKMMDLGYADEAVYSNSIYLMRAKQEDLEGALVLLQLAKKAFPNNADYVKEEIGILVRLDRVDEARISLEKAVVEDPENVNYVLNLGTIYDNMASSYASEEKVEESGEYLDKAQEAYEKAIELEPNNFIANFNLGALYVNRAKTKYDIARGMDIKTYMKDGKKYEQEGDEIAKKAIPFFLKAADSDPKDTSALETLKTVYLQLKMSDKVDEIISRIESIGG